MGRKESDKTRETNILTEGILLDTLPRGIIMALRTGESPFGSGIMGKNGAVLEKAVKSQFEAARGVLKNMGGIDSVDASTMEDALAKIIAKCQKIEDANKDVLEKLAVNYVIDLFRVPDDTVKFEAELVREVDGGDKISPVDPFDGEPGFELQDMDDLEGLDGEVAKRRLLNAINMGAGMRMSENIRGYLDDLYDIDSRLPQLYKEAVSLNNYLIFKDEKFKISDKRRRQIGIVDVNLGNSETLVNIHAKGVIFPVLLCELIRGIMELFSSHGLPKDRQRRDYVLGKADYLKAEPWDMRVGPYLWNRFTELLGDTDTEEMPYIYQLLAKQKPDFFIKVFTEMVAGTAKGKQYANKLVNKARQYKGQITFNNKMDTRQMGKSIITDGYMSPDEFNIG